MRDYWQFSRNINSSSSCSRSGINITKREFRKLGTEITSYLQANHRVFLRTLKESIGASAFDSATFQDAGAIYVFAMEPIID